MRSTKEQAEYVKMMEVTLRDNPLAFSGISGQEDGYFHAISKPSPAKVEFLSPSDGKIKEAVEKNPDVFSPFLPYKLACERIVMGNNDACLETMLEELEMKYRIEELETIYL